MKKKFSIFITVIAIVAGAFSVCLTAYAYFSYTLQVKVGEIKIADYAIEVTPILNPAHLVSEADTASTAVESENDTAGTPASEINSVQNSTGNICMGNNMVSIKFADLGIAEKEAVAFRLTGRGNTVSKGYCVITVKNIVDETVSENVYYTNLIETEQDYTVSINGNGDTEVVFSAQWGSRTVEEEGAVLQILEDEAFIETSSETYKSGNIVSEEAAEETGKDTSEDAAGESSEVAGEDTDEDAAGESSEVTGEDTDEDAAGESSEVTGEDTDGVQTEFIYVQS